MPTNAPALPVAADRFARGFVSSVLAGAVALLLPVSASAEIKIAVEDFRGAIATKAQWQPLADYLASALSEPVTLVPLTADKVSDAVGRKEVDFAVDNPALVGAVQATHGVELVATLVQPWGPQFAGLIITSPTTGIRTAADLKGKKLLSHTNTSAGGYLFQRDFLHQKGIEIPKDFAEVKELAKQDDIVLNVKAGIYDVGFIRTGILEDMNAKGKVQMSDFVVVDKVAPDASFPYVRTTGLYPEWYVMAAKGANTASVAKMKAALVAIKAESPTAKALGIKGFQDPLPIDPIINLLKALKVAPFDK